MRKGTGVLSEGPGGLTPAGGCNCHLQRERRGSAPDGCPAVPGVPWDARFFTSGLSRCPHPRFSLDEALPQPQSQPQDGSALLSAVPTPAAWRASAPLAAPAPTSASATQGPRPRPLRSTGTSSAPGWRGTQVSSSLGLQEHLVQGPRPLASCPPALHRPRDRLPSTPAFPAPRHPRHPQPGRPSGPWSPGCHPSPIYK